MTIKRPVLRWHGGKWILAPWIISNFPPHRIYVEPFGGAASVLLRKERVYSEVYNDLEQEVINLFRVLQDPKKSQRLCTLLNLTPFARDEYELCYKITRDQIERARRLIILSYMGFGSNGHSRLQRTGFRANSNRSGSTPAHDWANYPKNLPSIIERLRGVVIENRDAIDCMKQHDTPDTLHYVDPPYMWETRTLVKAGKHSYKYEMNDLQHENLLNYLNQVKGMVVLSGYNNPLYNKKLTGWRCVELQTHADGGRDRTECLWLNPAVIKAGNQPDLFEVDPPPPTV